MPIVEVMVAVLLARKFNWEKWLATVFLRRCEGVAGGMGGVVVVGWWSASCRCM